MNKLKVLLIDDDPISNFVASLTIQHLEIAEDIETCSGGQEGLDHIRSAMMGEGYLPDLIFLDINMPGMNGWEFLREFRKFPDKIRSGIKIVILTSTFYPADEIRGKEFPEVYDFVCKPLTKEDLEKVRSLVLHQ